MTDLVNSFMESAAPLSEEQKKRLAELEAIIREHQYGFRQVWAALWEIKRDRLYYPHKDLFEYIRYKWDGLHKELGRSTIYEMAKAGEVVENISQSTTVDWNSEGQSATADWLPQNTKQALALNKLPKHSQAPVWQEVLKQTNNKPTVEAINQVSQAYLNAPAPVEPELLAPEEPRPRTHLDRWASNYRQANRDTPSYKLRTCLDSLKAISAWSHQALEDGTLETYKMALEQIGNESDEKMQQVST